MWPLQRSFEGWLTWELGCNTRGVLQPLSNVLDNQVERNWRDLLKPSKIQFNQSGMKNHFLEMESIWEAAFLTNTFTSVFTISIWWLFIPSVSCFLFSFEFHENDLGRRTRLGVDVSQAILAVRLARSFIAQQTLSNCIEILDRASLFKIVSVIFFNWEIFKQ